MFIPMWLLVIIVVFLFPEIIGIVLGLPYLIIMLIFNVLTWLFTSLLGVTIMVSIILFLLSQS